MRNKIVCLAAAAFVLASIGSATSVAIAGPSPQALKKDSEIKDPSAANAAVAKDEAKDARKQAHVAKKKAKVAHHKAKAAARTAAKAAA